MLRLNKIQTLVVYGALFCIAAIPLIAHGKATGLSGSEFKAGNIIANNIFFNDTSMNSSQIQAFLNTKVPSCDTNGEQKYSQSLTRAQYGTSKGYPPPYICLKNYSQNTPIMNTESGLCNGFSGGNKTSAQIIYEVSQSCGVSPKVLLVLLQKEQSLVTDTWPWTKQYEKATGFACPDTAPCDPAYSGFFYQVYNAARQFKKYARDANNYNYRSGRNNAIQYNPNASCGSSNVYIENQATAGLYVYTPYQPNRAALDNLYGDGDGCSAYGNRNFWRMFNDWFGSTQFWSLMRTETSPALYKISGNRKINVPSQDIQEDYGYGSQPVSFVTQEKLNSYTVGNPYSNSLQTNIIKTPDDSDKDGGTVYVVTKGTKYIVPSIELFNAFGFSSWKMTFAPIEIIDEIPGTGNMSQFIQASDNSVYKVENGIRRVIFDPATLKSLNPSGAVTPASNYFISRFAPGKPLLSGPSLIVYPDKSVDLITDEKYYRVGSIDVLQCWGFTGVNKIREYRLPSWSNMLRTNEGSLGCGVSDGTNRYLLNVSSRLIIPSDVNIPTQGDLSSDLYSKLPIKNEAIKTAVKQPSSAAVWFIDKETGKKRLIPSINSYLALDINDQNTTVISASTLNSILSGPVKLGTGELFRTPENPAVYIINGEAKINIPSAELVESYGFSWSAVQVVGSTSLKAYPSATAPINHYFYNQDDIFIVGYRKAYKIPTSLYADYSINETAVRQGPLLDQKVYAHLNNPPTTIDRFLKSRYDNIVYFIDGGQKRPLGSWDAFIALSGNKPENIVVVSPDILTKFPTGAIKY